MRSHLLLAVTIALSACGGGSTTTTPSGGNNNPGASTNPVVTTNVNMLNSAFSPGAIQVAPSATVTFTNSDNTTHNVTFANATVGTSGDFSSGSKTLVMPAAVGTYTYRCTIHGAMTGSVLVQ